MKINGSQLKPVFSGFRPLYTFYKTIPVLDLTIDNIAMLHKYSDKKLQFLACRNLMEIVGSVFCIGGLITSVTAFFKQIDKLKTVGIASFISGALVAGIGWFWKSSRDIRNAVNNLSKNEEQNKPLHDFISNAIKGSNKLCSLGPKDAVENDKELKDWLQAFKEKMIFNATYLIPKTNPDKKDLIVYYPGFAYDVPNIISATDATTFICSSLERTLNNHDCPNSIVAIIREMGGEINESETCIPEDQEQGKAKIVFSIKSIDGTPKQRTLIFYYGNNVDAIKFTPDEVKNGYDILWSEGAPIFTNVGNTNIEAVKCLRDNGLVIRGDTQNIDIYERDEFLKKLQAPLP